MSATVITCPTPAFANGPSVFLAGGITGCPDWQTEAIQYLPDWVTAYNPRRPDFPINDPNAGPQQMQWEAERLTSCTAILMWFPKPDRLAVVQPISFFELGLYVAGMCRPAAVGVDDGFSRAIDVRHQLQLSRGPRFRVWPTLADTVDAAVRLIQPEAAAS